MNKSGKQSNSGGLVLKTGGNPGQFRQRSASEPGSLLKIGLKSLQDTPYRYSDSHLTEEAESPEVF